MQTGISDQIRFILDDKKIDQNDENKENQNPGFN